MPNYDAGHYFLTVLAPVRPDPYVDADVADGNAQSRRHALRDALEAMPTGARTGATQNDPPANPFARSSFTHFARFFVLDDVVYNGRAPRDGLLAALLKSSPLTPQKLDRLSAPFLVFVADFDAPDGSDAALDGCLSKLWETMQTELTAIFRHCLGFAGVTDAATFCAYIRKCQVETTMPFNDYWSTPPALRTFDLKPYVLVGAAAAALAYIGLFIFRPWLLLIGLFGLVATIFMAYRQVMEAGARAFPVSVLPAPPPDLPTVLKALAVQRGFTQFAIDTQGKGDADIHAAFGAFLAAARPDDLANATQIPGVIGV